MFFTSLWVYFVFLRHLQSNENNQEQQSHADYSYHSFFLGTSVGLLVVLIFYCLCGAKNGRP